MSIKIYYEKYTTTRWSFQIYISNKTCSRPNDCSTTTATCRSVLTSFVTVDAVNSCARCATHSMHAASFRFTPGFSVSAILYYVGRVEQLEEEQMVAF